MSNEDNSITNYENNNDKYTQFNKNEIQDFKK